MADEKVRGSYQQADRFVVYLQALHLGTDRDTVLALALAVCVTTTGCATFSAHAGAHWSQQAELIASDAAKGDGFGWSVAISGDTAFVGAWGKTVGGRRCVGTAYIFTRSGRHWSQQAELSDPDAASNDQFGWSVALNGNTASVGAPNKIASGKRKAGAVYIFTRSGTSWSQQAKLTVGGAAAYDHFGDSLALSDNTAFIGTPGRIVNGNDSAGAVYIFTRSGTDWSQQTELTPSDAGNGDQFGSPLALSKGELLVGAPEKYIDDKCAVGAAYVFSGSGASWSQQAELTASDSATNGFFGWSVAISGDTALVGAPGKIVAGKEQAGDAYVFTRSGTKWSQQAKLSNPAATTVGFFGQSVAISANRALVGTRSNTAYAYSFTRAATHWSQPTKLTASDAAAHEYFGFGGSLALSGNTALVGDWAKTVNGRKIAGAVYVEVLKK